MAKALRTAGLYVLTVFSIAFGFGIFRTLILAPRVGNVIAVCTEVPLILAVSWLVSRRLVGALPTGYLPRVVMGGAAFALLMIIEFAMALLVFGQTPAAYAAALLTTAGMIGLAGQIGFGLMPLVHRGGSAALQHSRTSASRRRVR